jgi:hypothetical protein
MDTTDEGSRLQQRAQFFESNFSQPWQVAQISVPREIQKRTNLPIGLEISQINRGLAPNPDPRKVPAKWCQTCSSDVDGKDLKSIPAVSVIVPNYNHARFCRSGWTTFWRRPLSYELIALDDASSDDSRVVLARYGRKRRCDW